MSNLFSLALMRRHEGTRPGRCIFDKGACKWNFGAVGVTDGMSDTGIRHTCHDVRIYIISLRQHISTGIAHLFYIDTFIGGSRITVINPKERTDLHFFLRRCDSFSAFRCEEYDFSRSQFFIIVVSQIEICKTLKRSTDSILFLTKNERSTSHAVSGGIDTFRGHDQHCHGTFDHFLRVADSLY